MKSKQKRTCIYCHKEFHELVSRIKQNRGKFCSKKCYNKHRSENKQDPKILAKFHQKKHKYGLSKEEYINLIKKSKGECCICGVKFDNRNKYSGPFVDHNHKTGKVRSVICNRCNRLIGMAEENIDIFKNIINYLKKHSNLPN